MSPDDAARSPQPGGAPRAAPGRLPSRPVSRPPRLRPTTRQVSPPAAGGPGAVLRTLSGSLLAVAAVALGVVVLLALRDPGGGDSTLRADGQGAARQSTEPSSSSSDTRDPAAGATDPAAGAADAAPLDPAAADPAADPAAGPPVDAAAADPAEVPPPPAPEPSPPGVPADVTVTVLGVGGPEVAEPTAARLRAEGWNVRLVASYRGDPPGATTLFHVEGRGDAAALLAGSTGATAVRPAPASLSDSDLTLVVAQ